MVVVVVVVVVVVEGKVVVATVVLMGAGVGLAVLFWTMAGKCWAA